MTLYQLEGIEGKPNLQLIDCPGFEDTSGMEEDKKTVEKIKQLFITKACDSLHGVFLVVKASDNKLTTSQKYIFNEI